MPDPIVPPGQTPTPAVTPPPPTPAPTPPPEKPPEADKPVSPRFLARMAGKEPPLPQPIDPNFKEQQEALEKLRAAAEKTAPPEPPKPPEKKEEPPPEKKDDPKPDDKPKRKVIKPKADPIPPQPTVDPEKIAAAAAEAAAKAVASVQPKPAAPVTVELTDEEKYQMKVLGELEEIMPDKYKGISKKAEAYLAEVSQLQQTFQAKWETENPIDQFESEPDPEGAREAAFTKEFNRQLGNIKKRTGYQVDNDDFIEARASLRVSAKLEKQAEELKELRQKVSKTSEVQEAEQLAPVVERAAITAGNDIAKEFAADKFVDKTGKIDADALFEADPETAHIKANAIAASQNWGATITQAFHGRANEQQANAVLDYCLRCEQAIKQMPAEEQDDGNGRMFATAAEFTKMTKAEQARHWVLTPEVVMAMKNNDITQAAKQAIETEQKRLAARDAKRGFKPGTTTPAAPAPSPKPVSPSASVTPNPGQAAGGSGGAQESAFARRMRLGVTGGHTL